ncbi:hypothetical protein KY289_014144 [Solanum tuberosum]|nr:hypothetical protein KY289_014144 [Solanum tuberosum]
MKWITFTYNPRSLCILVKNLKRTADFTPTKETSIVVVVWVLIHQLPWHLFRWDAIAKMVMSSIGTVVCPDQVTYSKSRRNVARIKVEINLPKPKLDQLWLGFNRLDGGEDGVWLKFVLSYCSYCHL